MVVITDEDDMTAIKMIKQSTPPPPLVLQVVFVVVLCVAVL